jgi:hypothetical protein
MFLRMFTIEGKCISKFVEDGNSNGQLNGPNDLVVDPNSVLYFYHVVTLSLSLWVIGDLVHRNKMELLKSDITVLASS